ncbi:16S rRNA (guanine(966)-N(2))-methyltransferase RsmD [Candidatus Chloroploca asiatica]|uniref:16S rRNA (Guanine(966)-N(2))-methyltransferase RsmD n=1 Tax=Candidatus Chloroploca asiatica TaxID=1506545 RepID=A0A2H3KQL1_9CHLR|nr:16S rRNA (guanine(966)-N(2))-methyltransferase RsmD [Candidatus Chloroploca asiatica]PDW00701.1 16S rRNA (guanine(966)-N(2))-methyltransferase RsmD [Candidatus Chloroploca asiatica]
MRVITGRAKGHKLKAPKGMGTRPMLDRVKESLFSVLEGYRPMRGRVLDLYAGTGSLGIELLSRGASFADFVEQNPHVCSIIRSNLVHTRLDAFARVHHMPVERFLQAHRGSAAYDYIVMDPPYADPMIEQTIATIATGAFGRPEMLLIVGHSPRVELAEQYADVTRIKFRRLGDSCFSIYGYGEEEAQAEELTTEEAACPTVS